MSQSSILAGLAQYRIVPVVSIDTLEAALPLADALLEGGLPIVEITFRTAVAAEVIHTLSRERPQLLVGAGTVLTKENLLSAHASGASFVVAPGTNSELVRQAAQLDVPFLPGVATPSDIELALGLGCKLLKFFPAEALGGVSMLEALSAPYRHMGVRFVPTGGIHSGNLNAYLRMDTVAAVGGTWIAKSEDLRTANWDAIRKRCQEAREIAAQLC